MAENRRQYIDWSIQNANLSHDYPAMTKIMKYFKLGRSVFEFITFLFIWVKEIIKYLM